MALPRRLLTLTSTKPPRIRPSLNQFSYSSSFSFSHSRSGLGSGLGLPPHRFFSAEAVADPANKIQVYISRSTDPYLNLSIEHFLLLKSAPNTVVLFLYTNRPCVVIGRNQNPWIEVNLNLLKHGNGLVPYYEGGRKRTRANAEEILLVRRRSGGGAVFHDAGNVNYSVICHPIVFNRDKHAELVVRALNSLGVEGARVNERHDIVLDVPIPTKARTPGPKYVPKPGPVPADHDAAADPAPNPAPTDSDATPAGPSAANAADPADPVGSGASDAAIAAATTDTTAASTPARDKKPIQTFKISGSAYKLTRQRSLHHGTCLLASPNIGLVSALLNSPAAPFITAKGVGSVRSPVRNVWPLPENTNHHNHSSNAKDNNEIIEARRLAFEKAVVAEFGRMYKPTEPVIISSAEARETLDFIPDIIKGYNELRSQEWLYTQTPTFKFSTDAIPGDPRPTPILPVYIPPGFHAGATIKRGQIVEMSGRWLPKSLKGTHLHRVADWAAHVDDPSVARWLNGLFGIEAVKKAARAKASAMLSEYLTLGGRFGGKGAREGMGSLGGRW